jgi:hypothetical protein
MNKRKLGLAAVMGVSCLAAVFLACQSDVADPTPIELPEEYDNNPALWEFPAIYGYCTEPDNTPIYMAKVTWESTSGPSPEILGYCITRWDGWYRITDFTGAWEPYEGDTLAGTAIHVLELYPDAYNEIEDYVPVDTYRRDFEMDPDPGQENISKNGLFSGYVKRIDGSGIYPATVTIKGYDGVFLGYDTV